MNNPLTDVYDALWDALERSPAVAGLIQPGNRVKLNRYSPFKETLQPGDAPELVVVPVGGVVHVGKTSTHHEVIASFGALLSTTDYRAPFMLFPATWAVLAAIASNPSLGLSYVYGCELDVGAFRPDGGEQVLPREIRGWALLLTVNYRLKISRKEMEEWTLQAT